mmetsp:Transcript_55791/g.179053  ORF Transcript_55791/g.179053 Transcript_55791/m.179053 type:complete len:540 (+) Transcript_55791:89-1708(+)
MSLGAGSCAAPLTRADVRDEVQAALVSFAEEALRRELEHLGNILRQAFQDAIPEDLADGLLQRQDLRNALDEWWANSSESGGAACKQCRLAELGTLTQEPQCGASHGFQGCRSYGSTTSTNAPSPPASPFSLPGAPSVAEGLELSTPLTSPTSSPASAPVAPAAFPPLPPSAANRKDWRRSFVEKATKANRKVEYLHGFQGREAQELNDALEEAARALEAGVKPHLVEDGLGGTYFVRDCGGRSIAVFKPRDEEPLAPNNPKVHTGAGQGMGLKDGVLVGEAALNEYAAFLLDQASGPALHAGVCPTALVRVANSVFHSATEDRRSAFREIKDKVGSFQLFARHDCTSEDLGPGRFPDEQVHRIAALDIRLCNTDRHSGNILVRERGREVEALVPIDHGYALPGEIGAEVTLEWLSWPAARSPFSDAMRREILAIDIDAVEVLLKKRIPLLRAECLATLRTCTRLLQLGVEAGLTAFHIGSLLTRPACQADEEPPCTSVLEELVTEARRQAEHRAGSEPYELVLDRLIRAKCCEVAAGL